MNPKSFLDWWPVWTQSIIWLVILVIAYQKLVDKVNGQGERITENKASLDKTEGRVDRMEREMLEYRRDAQDAARGLARVEKGVEGLSDNVQQGNLGLGSLIHEVERKIDDKDRRTQVRLTRIETVAKIEEKIGPLPTDDS